MLFLGVLFLFVFHFAFNPSPARTSEMAAGLLWLTFLFAGILGLNYLFQPEREGHCLEALLLSPMDRGALYLSKVLFNFLLMALIEIMVFPLFAVLFNLDLWRLLPSLLGVSLLGTLGFCAMGTTFSALTLMARARELLLPLLLLPLVIPLILGTIRGMEALFQAGPSQELYLWLRLLIGFDLIFLTAGFLLFGWILEAS
jgi:heme exporter protein B